MTHRPMKPGGFKPASTDFDPADDIIGHEWLNLSDQEFSPYDPNAPTFMAYRQAPHIFLAEIDRGTGMILGNPEKDRIEISDQAADFVGSGFQGPEWGFNTREGLVLVFTATINDRSQIAYSKPTGPRQWSEPTVLTNAPDGRLGASPSKRGEFSTQVVYRRWQPPKSDSETSPQLVGPQQFYWMDLNDEKKTEHTLPFGILAPSQPPQFAYQRGGSENPTCDLIFGMEDKGFAQVFRYDTSTGALHPRTQAVEGRAWHHWDPSCFKAAEYPGRIVYAVNVLESDDLYPNKMAIYTESPGREFEMLDYQGILEIPQHLQDEGFVQISSVEQIATKNATFFSVLLVKPGKGDPLYDTSTVWIWSLNGDLKRRVSGNHPREGDFLGKDPEIMLGTDELFVYYNVYGNRLAKPDNVLVDLHRCRTGVGSDGTYTP